MLNLNELSANNNTSLTNFYNIFRAAFFDT